MGFTTDHAFLVHHLMFHLEKFSQTPQGTSFTKLLDNWDKTYGYGYKYTNIQFDQLITTVTAANDKRWKAPGYNKEDDIIGGRTTEITPQPLGLIGQEMFEKGLFAGVESVPGIDDYPLVDIETLQHSTRSKNATIYTLVKSAVEQAMEARDTTKKNQSYDKRNSK